MNVRNRIINLIKEKKNIRLDEFINHCLHKQDSYYVENNPIGENNDFVTAPEISQMFGEIIGSYILNYWLTNINSDFKLIELGPGKGTLLKDILRVAETNKKFLRHAHIDLIEQNNKLIKFQKATIDRSMLNIKWKNDFNFNSTLPYIFYSNEFFDCLAIRQFFKKDNWLEKYVSYDENSDYFYFKNKKTTDQKIIKRLENYYKNGIAEISTLREIIFDKICREVNKNKGVIITIDYGYENVLNNFSLQSVFKHKKTHIFENIGKQDISSLVNFKELIDIAKKNELKVDIFYNQKKFLLTHGLKERKNILKKNKSKKERDNLEKEYDRLINDDKMGKDFKILIVSHK